MGTDVHFVVEMRDANSHEFIGVVYSQFLPLGILADKRDTEFFERLKQGTHKTPYPAFYEINISNLSRYWVEYYGSDGHSFGCMSVKEYADIYFECNPNDKIKDFGRVFHVFGFDLDIPEDAEFRIVYWFDN